MIEIPDRLRESVAADADAARPAWLAALPERVASVTADWGLRVGPPYRPGGECAWVAPAVDASGRALAVKLAWRHYEAEHEADGLAVWDGDGVVRCLARRRFADTDALLLERCAPGTALSEALPEPEQDAVIAGLLRRLWAHEPPDGYVFESLTALCDTWAESLERSAEACPPPDPGLAREGMAALRELPRTAQRTVLLCTDLHAGNVLAAEREPWLAIDPKPFVGDPAFDALQHMLNCDARLADDPVGLAHRMAELLELDPERVTRWLFARCVQESPDSAAMLIAARRLAQ